MFNARPFALADYYWRAFKAAVEEADARGMMCSYNAVMDTPACLSPLLRNARRAWGCHSRRRAFWHFADTPSPSLLKHLLKGEGVRQNDYDSARRRLGFQGYVTSDTDSVDSATTGHHYTADAEHATALALTHGQCDINSGGTYKGNR